MQNLKELNRRIFVDDGSGEACGPCGIFGVDAEMVVEDEGKTVYLHAQWNSETNDYMLEATTRSIYDIYEKMHHCESNDEIEALVYHCDEIAELAARDPFLSKIDHKERYYDQYMTLVGMIGDEIAKLDFEPDEDEDYEEEE